MLTTDLILCNVNASSKKQAFEHLAAQAAGLFFGVADDLIEGMQARERLGSTGIGGGAAIPHLKVSGLKKMYGVLMTLENAVDYDAPDGQPVDLLFLLVVPDGDKTTLHLKALAQAARFLKDPVVCQRLRAGGQSAVEALVADWLKKQQAA